MPIDTEPKGPTMKTTANRSLLLLAIAAAAAACGGSSTSDPGPSPTANKVLQGTITARTTGQIVVNGVTLSTPARVKIEKVDSPESELHKGMVVKVKAQADDRTGQAIEVEFEDVAKGKVEAVFDDNTLSVGGQTVRVDDSTEFEDNTNRLGSLVAGVDRVRVSGVPDDKGGLRATRIDRVGSTSDDFEVKGVVTGISGATFTLKTSVDAAAADTYTVDSAAVTLPAGFAIGWFVEVHSPGPVQAGRVIVADRVSREDRLGAAQSEVEVEGIVTSGTPNSFVAAGVTVTTTDATLWTGGVAADLIPGVKVEAEGTLQADGSLAARKVSFRYSSKLQGAVTDLAVAADGTGTFKVNGILVRVDAITDQRDTGLTAGELVELRGYLGRDAASLVATRVERRNDDRPIIQGVVTAKDAAAGTLTILGKTIDTSSVEANGFHDFDPSSGVDGPPIAKDAFFAAVTVGETVVKGRGRNAAAFADPTLTAKEVELEGER
jgi:hypothetical protein